MARPKNGAGMTDKQILSAIALLNRIVLKLDKANTDDKGGGKRRVAEKLGVTPANIGHIINKKRAIDAGYCGELVKLCAELGIKKSGCAVLALDFRPDIFGNV